MSLQTLRAAGVTYEANNDNGGWDHVGNPCRVGTDDIHKVNDPAGVYYDGGVPVSDDVQGHIHAVWTDETGPNTSEVRFSFEPLGPVFAIESVKLLVRAWRSGGSYNGQQFRPFLYLRSDPGDPMTAVKYYIDPTIWAPLDYDGDYAHAPFGGPIGDDQHFVGTNYILDFSGINPATLVPYTREDINTAEGGFIGTNVTEEIGNGPFLGTIQLLVIAAGAPDQQEQSRDVTSRYEWLHRQTLRRLENMPVRHSISRPLRPGDILKVAHFAGPEGWKVRPVQQRRFLITEIERRDDGVDMISGIEWHDVSTLYYDSMLMESNIDITTEDGVLRVSRGQGRTYTRVGQAWELDPGSGTYVRVETNERPYAAKGVGSFEEYKNVIFNSSFKDGDITGWTKVGEGTNGSFIVIGDETIGAAAGETIGWDKDSTGILQSVAFVAGTPHTADLYLESDPSDSLDAGAKFCWQVIWTRYVVNQPMYAALQRNVDSKWLQTDGTWDTAIAWHNLTLDNLGSRIGDPTSTVEAWSFGQIVDIGGSGSTLTVRIGMPTGLGVVDRQSSRLYHAQAVPDALLVSAPPIVTEATAVTRNVGLIQSRNDSTARQFIGVGSFGVRITPAWRGSDQAANSFRFVLSYQYDADNYVDLFFVKSRTADSFTGFVLQVVSGGIAYEAKISTSVIDVIPGKTVDLVARLTGGFAESAAGENKMTLFLLGVAAQPIKSDESSYVTPIATASALVETGSKNSADYFGGHLQIYRSAAQVVTNLEAARFIR